MGTEWDGTEGELVGDSGRVKKGATEERRKREESGEIPELLFQAVVTQLVPKRNGFLPGFS